MNADEMPVNEMSLDEMTRGPIIGLRVMGE
jgi:hypothetical protein